MDATGPRALRQLLDLTQMALDRVHLRVFHTIEQAFHEMRIQQLCDDSLHELPVGEQRFGELGREVAG